MMTSGPRLAALVGLLLWQTGGAAERIDAVLEWGQRVELGTLVSGVVSEIPVQAGQRVEPGEVLLRLDPRGFRAQVARAEAERRRARVRFEEAQREDERAVELYDRTVLSDRERQLAVIGLETARAELEAAEAQRVQAGLDLERSVIRAPFAGVVVSVDAAVGQVIVSQLQSRPLMVLADDRRLQARGRIAADQVERLAGVESVPVSVRGVAYPGGPPQIGLEPVSTGAEGLYYSLRVPLAVDPDIRLRAGGPAAIEIPD